MITTFVKQRLAFLFFVLFCSLSAGAQTGSNAKNKSPFPVKYTSLTDQNILLKTITLAPVYDNVNGIFSVPVEKLLLDLLQNDKSWGYAEIKGFDKNSFIENYDINPNNVLETLTKSNAQGLITAFITKGPRGISAKLKLFTHDQGLILNEESMEDINTFEVSKVRESFVTMYYNLKNKLPYRGYVLSRRGQDVTISLGSINGVKAGQELTLAQIIKLNRHPKLKTLVGVEKEIIAKVIVEKVDTYLSFAKISFEKETGVVDVGAKVLPSEFLTYPVPKLSAEGGVVGDAPARPSPAEIKSREYTDVVIKTESEPKSEVLDRKNSTGVFTAQGVITQYNENNNLNNGQSVNSRQSFAPGIFLGLRYNFKTDYFVDVSMQMNSFSAANGLPGSTPFNLSYSYTYYAAAVGYIYNYDDSTDGITFAASLGIDSYKTAVSASSPVSLTSIDTNAMLLHLKALMPLAPEYPFSIGAKFDLPLSVSTSESPVNSGSSKASITSLGFFAIYPINEKLHARFDLGLTNLTNRFSGSATRVNPAASGSIELMNEKFGIEYLF